MIHFNHYYMLFHSFWIQQHFKNDTLLLKWINVNNSISHLGHQVLFGTLCSMSVFTIYLKTKIIFSWWSICSYWHMQVSPKWFLCWCCSYKCLGNWWRDMVIFSLCVSNYCASSSTSTFVIEFLSFLSCLQISFQWFHQVSHV